MSDETWREIYRRERPLVLPAAPPPRPLPPTRTPKCDTHCSGKHGEDGVMRCTKCGGIKYVVQTHEYANSEGHYFYEMVPVNGAPPHLDHAATPRCCGREMRRMLG